MMSSIMLSVTYTVDNWVFLKRPILKVTFITVLCVRIDGTLV